MQIYWLFEPSIKKMGLDLFPLSSTKTSQSQKITLLPKKYIANIHKSDILFTYYILIIAWDMNLIAPMKKEFLVRSYS